MLFRIRFSSAGRDTGKGVRPVNFNKGDGVMFGADEPVIKHPWAWADLYGNGRVKFASLYYPLKGEDLLVRYASRDLLVRPDDA